MVVRPRSPRAPAPASATHAIVDAVPLPAALLDDHGRIVRLNDAWEEHGRPGGLIDPSDEPGRDHVADLREKGFSRDAGRALADALERVVRGDRERMQHDYRIDVEGQAQHWQATAARMELDGDAMVLLVHQDVTNTDRADQMTRRVASLMIDREHVGAVAHDRQRLVRASEQSFHAPLTPIRLQLHLLQGGSMGDLNERQAKALTTIERNVNRWWRLQEELISDLHALEDQGHAAETSDLVHLADEALQPFRERALKAGIRLRIDRTDEALPVHVARRPMVQVILLVLDHAIRQTPSGGLVWVQVHESAGEAELVIHDQDPTIDPQGARALLGDDAGTDATLRSGLLHARRVIDRHQGRLTTHCEAPGEGLEVRLSLPLAGSPQEAKGLATGEASRYL